MTRPYITNGIICFCRTYGSFTMETIIATAFGRNIDIQGGEADELTRVVKAFFSQREEGQLADREVLVLLNSESLSSPHPQHSNIMY